MWTHEPTHARWFVRDTHTRADETGDVNKVERLYHKHIMRRREEAQFDLASQFAPRRLEMDCADGVISRVAAAREMQLSPPADTRGVDRPRYEHFRTAVIATLTKHYKDGHADA